MNGSSARRRDPIPDFPIAEILAALTDIHPDDVPTGSGWVRMRCPFHEDRTPSAGVNHDVNGFRCWSCDREGDSLKLLQNERGISFTEALEQAKAITGVEVKRGKAKARSRRASDLLRR